MWRCSQCCVCLYDRQCQFWSVRSLWSVLSRDGWLIEWVSLIALVVLISNEYGRSSIGRARCTCDHVDYFLCSQIYQSRLLIVLKIMNQIEKEVHHTPTFIHTSGVVMLYPAFALFDQSRWNTSELQRESCSLLILVYYRHSSQKRNAEPDRKMDHRSSRKKITSSSSIETTSALPVPSKQNWSGWLTCTSTQTVMYIDVPIRWSVFFCIK